MKRITKSSTKTHKLAHPVPMSAEQIRAARAASSKLTRSEVKIKISEKSKQQGPFDFTPQGLKLRSLEENVQILRNGYPFSVLAGLSAHLNLSQEGLLESVGISKSTAMRRRDQQHLKPQESDKVYQLAKVVSLAEEVFGDLQKSHEWLHRSNRALGGATPFSRLDTSAGTDEVTELLGRISHGVYS